MARVPITATVIVFEMTTDFNLVLALMMSCVIASLVAERLHPGSIYDNLLRWQGIDLDESNDKGPLTGLKARDFMRRSVEFVPATATVREAIDVFLNSHHRGFPVIRDGELVGMITVVHAPKFIDNEYSEDSFALFEGDRCVGHVLRTGQAPQGKPWFWTIFTRGVSDTPDRGYAATRERAIENAKARLSGD